MGYKVNTFPHEKQNYSSLWSTTSIKPFIGSGRTGSGGGPGVGGGGGGGGMCVPTSKGMHFQNLGTNSECEFGEICHQQK